MKKIMFLFFFFVPLIGFAQRKTDRTREVRDSIFREIVAKDSTERDSVTFLKDFNLLIKICKVKKIYLRDNATRVSHYFPWNGVMLINLQSGGSLLDKFSGELVHGEQFASRPLFYYKKATAEILGAFARSVLKRKKYKATADSLVVERKCSRFIAYLWASYQEQYYRVNSFEYHHLLFDSEVRKFLWGPPKKKRKEIKIENY
jgi:hypothetical protein